MKSLLLVGVLIFTFNISCGWVAHKLPSKITGQIMENFNDVCLLFNHK